MFRVDVDQWRHSGRWLISLRPLRRHDERRRRGVCFQMHRCRGGGAAAKNTQRLQVAASIRPHSYGNLRQFGKDLDACCTSAGNASFYLRVTAGGDACPARDESATTERVSSQRESGRSKGLRGLRDTSWIPVIKRDIKAFFAAHSLFLRYAAPRARLAGRRQRQRQAPQPDAGCPRGPACASAVGYPRSGLWL
jgi:hypothetical protein